MESKEYVNPFIDVHRKAKALKDRAHKESKKEEIRKQRQIQGVIVQNQHVTFWR